MYFTNLRIIKKFLIILKKENSAKRYLLILSLLSNKFTINSKAFVNTFFFTGAFARSQEKRKR